MNPHEFNARARKVKKIVAIIDEFPPLILCGERARVMPGVLRTLPQGWWDDVAAHAGVNKPSQDTINDVVAVYERREAVA